MVGTWWDTGEGLDLFSGEFFTTPAVSLVTSGSLPAMLPALEETGRSQGQSGHSQAWRSSEQRLSAQVTAGQVALGLAFPWVAQVLLLPGKPPGCLYCPSYSPRNSHLLELPPPPKQTPQARHCPLLLGTSCHACSGPPCPAHPLLRLGSCRVESLSLALASTGRVLPSPTPRRRQHTCADRRDQGWGLCPLLGPGCASQAVCIHRPHWRSIGCLVGSVKVEGVLPVGGEFGEGK